MSSPLVMTPEGRAWVRENILLGHNVRDYLRSLVTPWNLVGAAIVAVGLPVIIARFIWGLGATTNLSNTNPWGIWLGFDMFFGVAIATGGFAMVVGVYILGRTEYKPMVRPAILTGFLGYALAVFGLAIDLGRPWRLPYPLFVSMGTASVMFLVAEHLCLYITIQFLEFLPAAVEWLRLRAVRAWLHRIHIGAVILGSVLVMGHQSALGALFLLMPTRLHPLWYSPYLPYLFFASCVAGGIAMLVVESLVSHKVFGHKLSHNDHETIDKLTLGLGKAAMFALFAYLGLKLLSIAHGMSWNHILTGWGAWWAFEIVAGIALPSVLFLLGIWRESATLVRWGSVVTVLGLLLNRMNVAVIALNWNLPDRYVPSWMEIAVSATLVVFGVWIFRWIVNRMPILNRLPEFPDHD